MFTNEFLYVFIYHKARLIVSFGVQVQEHLVLLCSGV